MIVHILQSVLLAGLKAAGSVVPGRPSLPILSNALIVAEGSSIKICATDLDQYIEVTLDAQVEKAGGCCFPLKNLLDTVSEIPGGQICLRHSDADWHLKLESEMVGFRGRLATIDSAEFPAPPTFEKNATIDFPVSDLRAFNRRVAFAVSTDQTRLALNGICLRKVYKHIEAVATDGYRLSRLDLPNTIAAEGESWIVPPKAAHLADKFAADSEEPVRLHCAPDGAVFELPAVSPFLAVRIWTKLLEGPYPAYGQVIPKSTAWTAVFERESLTRTVKRVRAVAKCSTTYPMIKFDASGGRAVTISGSGSGAEGQEQIGADIVGEMPPMAWNGNLLVEILELLDSPQIVIRGNSSTQATVLEPKEEKPSILLILMPLRRAE